ncbi:PQ-loop repeat-containing protein [Maribellus mangrovi]|uniref:PQ-loop repeat-containing protein n=1 Tax=Maribellus mangrovi TaxID=3133146 RepID=UPI0030ED9948
MINETIGWVGNILFAICGIPQVIKTYRSKSAKDLSLLFLWLWMSGELLTFVYILIGDWETGIAHFPLYFNYIANIFMATYLIWAKYTYPKKHSTK